MITSTAKEYTPNQLSAMGAEEFLTVCGAAFTVMTSGQIRVTGGLLCNGLKLERLPDLTNVVCEMSFICSHNNLKDLAGAPREVGGNFNCESNKLITLKGAPSEVGGNFNCCRNNELETLHHAPRRVGGDFFAGNGLKTLEGAPEEVGGWFNCRDSQLVSLKGCPRKVGKTFVCDGNKLETLEHAPDEIGERLMLSGNPIKDFSALPLCGQAMDLDEEQFSVFESERQKLGLHILVYSQSDDLYSVSRGSVADFVEAVRAQEIAAREQQEAERVAHEAAEYQRSLDIVRNNPAKFKLKR